MNVELTISFQALRVGDGLIVLRARGSAPARSSVHFRQTNIASASRHALVVFLGLMLGKCWSPVANGLLLVIRQELTCGLSVYMNLWLPLSNPAPFL